MQYLLLPPQTSPLPLLAEKIPPAKSTFVPSYYLPLSYLFAAGIKKETPTACSKSLAVSSLSELFFNNCTDEEVHLFWSATPFYWVHSTKVIFKSQLHIFYAFHRDRCRGFLSVPIGSQSRKRGHAPFGACPLTIYTI